MVHFWAFRAFKNGLVEPCARHDSNVRPLPPQGSALSPELRARDWGVYRLSPHAPRAAGLGVRPRNARVTAESRRPMRGLTPLGLLAVHLRMEDADLRLPGTEPVEVPRRLAQRRRLEEPDRVVELVVAAVRHVVAMVAL
jgi:hypothetical protein